jgi:hypothetical protein
MIFTKHTGAFRYACLLCARVEQRRAVTMHYRTSRVMLASLAMVMLGASAPL